MANLQSMQAHSGVRILDSDGDPIDTIDLISNPKDFAGRRAFNTVFGEHVMGWRSDSISCQFQYSNSTRDVVAESSGSGVATNSDSMAHVALGTAVGSCSLRSIDAVRYRPGHELMAQFTSRYDGAQVGVNQYHGLLNGADGVTFGTKDGVFGVWHILNSVVEFTPQSEFNMDKLDGTGSGFILDPAKLNLYMVQYGWLGVAPTVYSVYCGAILGWRVCHIVDHVNMVTVPHLGNPSLPVQVKVERLSGTGTAAMVSTASWRAGVVAGETEYNNADRWFANTQLDVVLGGAAGTVYNLLTIRNKTTYQGKTNHVPLEIGISVFDNSTNKTLAVYGSFGATLTGNSAYTDVSTADSVAEYSTGGTSANGTRGPATVLRKDAYQYLDVRGTNVVVHPGETLTFEVVGASAFTGTFSVSTRWVEYF